MTFDQASYDDLMKQVSVIRDRVRAVHYGYRTGLYFHGRPGTSKTHTGRTTLEDLAAPYKWHSGHLTPIGLFELIAENPDHVIVLDDVTSIFNQPTALEILLSALAHPHNGSGARVIQSKTAHKEHPIYFTGGIIAISNLALDGHQAQILTAVRDRVNVIHYDPTDEQVLGLIGKIADEGVAGIPTGECRMVAHYLREKCLRREIRPSVRLFVDKAIPDYALWKSERSETHWRDLIASELEQRLVEIQYPQRDLTWAERTEAERRVALDIILSYSSRQERVERWKYVTRSRFGQPKSQAAFYRRLAELKESGQLSGVAS
jgi:hypothetical protein